MREHFIYRYFLSRIAVVQKGKDLLPRCDLCGMNMPERRLIKHERTQRCDRNTQMLWRRRDAAIARRCAEASFSLAGEDEQECIEGVETFKYLVLMMDWSDNDCPVFRRNVGKAPSVDPAR